MAASKAELWDQLSKTIRIVDELWKFTAVNTPNFITMQDTLEQAYEGNHISATAGAILVLRNSIATAVVTQSRATISELLKELVKIGYSSEATSPQLALAQLAFSMDAASETVAERATTFNAISAGGSNVGDGTVYRVTFDPYGNKIEGGAFDGGITRCEIVSDKNTGRSSGNELMKIFGSGIPPIDNLDLGNAPYGNISAEVVSTNQISLIANSGFEDSSGTGGSDITFDNWTLGSSTDADVDTTNFHRTPAGDTAPQSLKFTDDNTILQYIADGAIDADLPVIFILRYNREVGSCDGTLTIRLGSKTEDVTLSAQTGWNDLVLGVTANEGWYDEFKEDNAGEGVRVYITLTSRSTGTLLIDSLIVSQPHLYNGCYYLPVAGENDFLERDYFTFTDAVAGTSGGTGRIQFTLARLYGMSLPHTSSGFPTYADAT